MAEWGPSESTTCDVCEKSISKFFEISGSHRGFKRAIHKLCSWHCFREHVLPRKQGEWEKAVENDEYIVAEPSTSKK
jgi:hypothetical protein